MCPIQSLGISFLDSTCRDDGSTVASKQVYEAMLSDLQLGLRGEFPIGASYWWLKVAFEIPQFEGAAMGRSETWGARLSKGQRAGFQSSSSSIHRMASKLCWQVGEAASPSPGHEARTLTGIQKRARQPLPRERTSEQRARGAPEQSIYLEVSI